MNSNRLKKWLVLNPPSVAGFQPPNDTKEITKIATDIDKSSAAKAQKATEANVKKMDAAIAALQKNLKAK